MIEHYVPSLGLLRGLRVRDFESITELETAANEKGACLRIANKYLVEKTSLVDGRDKVAEELEKLTGFPMVVNKTVKADGSVTETPGETEVQYLARFRKAVLAGDLVNDPKVHPRFNKDNLEEALQYFADSLGTFDADAKRQERGPRQVKIPKWITERVETIFQNGTTLRWWDIMQQEAIPIPPLNGDQTKDKLALALAIRERQARRELEESKKYA